MEGNRRAFFMSQVSNEKENALCSRAKTLLAKQDSIEGAKEETLF